MVCQSYDVTGLMPFVHTRGKKTTPGDKCSMFVKSRKLSPNVSLLAFTTQIVPVVPQQITPSWKIRLEKHRQNLKSSFESYRPNHNFRCLRCLLPHTGTATPTWASMVLEDLAQGSHHAREIWDILLLSNKTSACRFPTPHSLKLKACVLVEARCYVAISPDKQRGLSACKTSEIITHYIQKYP